MRYAIILLVSLAILSMTCKKTTSNPNNGTYIGDSNGDAGGFANIKMSIIDIGNNEVLLASSANDFDKPRTFSLQGVYVSQDSISFPKSGLNSYGYAVFNSNKVFISLTTPLSSDTLSTWHSEITEWFNGTKM